MKTEKIHFPELGATAELATFATPGGITEQHAILHVEPRGDLFDSQFDRILRAEAALLAMPQCRGSQTIFKRYFLSDSTNQQPIIEAQPPVGPQGASVSCIQQAPLDGSKVAAWLYIVHDMDVTDHDGLVIAAHNGYRHLWKMGMHEHKGDSAWQTESLLIDYEETLQRYGATLADNCIRTWFYVRDVDTQYAGMVKARRENFAEQGLTRDTHFITSTGIGGLPADTRALIQLGTYALIGFQPEQQRYLYAPTHLNPTYEYGVTFERGTRIDYGDRRHVYISGTASINNRGEVMHVGDIVSQTRRMWENVEALLAEAGTTTDDITTDEVQQSFTWQISDAEPTTALSVDVFNSPANWGPIFRTRGGQSSQPYEGATYTRYFQPGTQLDEATMRVEKPELRIDGANTVTDVPTGGQAKFNLQLYNASETNSVCIYNLKVLDGSNPNGAQLFIDGTPLSNGGEGRSVKMKGGEQISKQLILMQSDRYIRDYEGIKLVLCSTNDTATVSDPVVLNAHFIPASALVDMAVNQTVLNQEMKQKNGGVIVTMRNLDYEDESLAGLRVRYRKKGIGSWTLAREWSVDSVKAEMAKSPNKQISTAVAFPEDGLYEVQAQTFGTYGNTEVTYETENVEVLQDTHGPKLLGMVSPEDGQLTVTVPDLKGNVAATYTLTVKSGEVSVETDSKKPYKVVMH